jgi:hypothetical protein
MNDSCAIGSPAHSLIGTRVRLFSSSVSVPCQPGSQKPAVAWTIRPEAAERGLALDPRDDVVGQLDVLERRAEAELARVDHERLVIGPIVIGSVRFVGGSRRSIAEARWLWNTRKVLPSRRSTLAGWTSAGSQGSILIVPSSHESADRPVGEHR